jgi:3-dehydro-4-phosphotetronate decarboxylase
MTFSKEFQAREEICRVGRSLFERGYVHATAGNISVKLEDGFLITPTDACLGFLDPEKLAKLDSQLTQISGDRASKTIALHAGIYSASAPFSTQAACIIHTHSTHCVAKSLQTSVSELLAALTPYFVMKVGHVPMINYHRPGDAAAAREVAETITRYGQRGTPIRAVMLPRLGPNVWSANPMSAMAVLEELEETAKIALLQPETKPLLETQIEELRKAFNVIW